MKLISKTLNVQQPDLKTGVLSMVAYSNNVGRLIRYTTYTGSSDAFKDSAMEISKDNGESYGELIRDKTRWPVDAGMMTRYFKLTAIDPVTDRFYMFYNQGLLPGDKPEDGLKNWQLYYMMSEDGGKTFDLHKPVVLTGEYNELHPIRDVWRGKNSFMVGDWPCEPIIRNDGTILLAVQCTMIDENGDIYNPGGGYTYQYSVLLHGRFLVNGEIEWYDMSNRVEGDPEKSTRGAIEPSVMDMSDSRILMICRGSNGGPKDPDCKIPGYRWYSISTDGGHTFNKPEPWKYTTGEKFHSPSSCSQILKHSNGKFYWIGNICKDNSRANMPRNPLCICEIDKKTLMLKKETKFDIIKREAHQYHDVTFSNFYAREERKTGDVLIYCSALWQSLENTYLNASSYEYRLRL